MDHSPLRWGILGTGTIAHAFAHALQAAPSSRLVAVGSRGRESASKFAGEFGSVSALGGYAELLADPEVEAVYIATPHAQHAEWAVAAS